MVSFVELINLKSIKQNLRIYGDKNMDEKWMFGICDGEYILRMNENVLIAKIKSPIQEYLNLINEYKSRLEEEGITKEQKRKLEEKIIANYKKANIKSLPYINPSELFSFYLASIMKHKRENNVMYLINVFDKTPYYHKTAIENYKGDRYNSTDVAKELEEELKREDLTPNERAILEYDKALADYDSENFWKYQEVKKSFLENKEWAKAGVHAICKRGYEADQLAYFISHKISKIHKKDKKVNCILLSVDKDWLCFTQPGVVFKSIWNGNLKDRFYGELLQEWDDFHETYKWYAEEGQEYCENWKDIKMYDYGILKELFVKSHNNATLYEEQDDGFRDYLIEKYYKDNEIEKPNRNDKYDAKYMADVEMFFRIINKCKHKKFKSYTIMRKAFKAMNVWLGKTVDNGYCDNIGTSYSDDLQKPCMQILKMCDKYQRETISKLSKEYNFEFNPQTYIKFVTPLNNVNFSEID